MLQGHLHKHGSKSTVSSYILHQTCPYFRPGDKDGGLEGYSWEAT